MTVRTLVPRSWSRRRIPVRYVNRAPASPVQRNFNQLFDEFFNEFSFALRPSNGAGFNPSVDISENDTEIKIEAELPGLDEDDVEVSLADNVLTISGEKKAENEDEGENYYHLERSYGSFKRSVTLSHEVDADEIDATFKNGVLQITLPKLPDDVKKIEVKAV